MARRLRFAALGAALVYFFDPDNGKRRRKVTADRLVGFVRRRGLMTEDLNQKVTQPQPDDVSVAPK